MLFIGAGEKGKKFWSDFVFTVVRRHVQTNQ